MCEHEGQQCPGRSCQCECMNCMFPDDPDDDEDMHSRIARHIGLEVGESKQVKFQGKTWTMRRTQ